MNLRPSKTALLVPVFVPAVVIIALLVIGTVSNPDLAGKLFADTLGFITAKFGWFYMLCVAIFLVFVVTVALTKWGQIRLGPDHAEPEYGFVAWFAMLFSAGYGIALLFFGVAEPVLHYASPPEGAAQTIDAAKQAMLIAFFHWGFHIWAIYGLVGLTLAYFAFRHGLPLSMRSTLFPLIGEKIHRWPGHVVDLFAILGTLFGIATTLGLSVVQINAGLNYLWPAIPIGTTTQVIAIALITCAAIVSVVLGMDKGIKRLSLLNIGIAVGLMAFVFIAGPTIFILETFLENTGSYLSGIVERTFSLQAYVHSDWIGNWTLFIFGWTIAWAPFVGLFIAKISRGRTIRQFVFGVMFVPTLFTFMWFSIFGDTALHLILVEGYTALIDQVHADKAVALFKLYEHLPLTSVLSIVTVFLIVTFFVTSSDSGSLVIDSLASGGAPYTPVWQRVFWASTEGVVAAVLLIAGGLGALQTASIVSALPFAVIMLIAAVGMWRALVIEGHRETSLQHPTPGGALGRPGGWKNRLGQLVSFPDRAAVAGFIRHTGLESMQQVADELKRRGWPAQAQFDEENDRAIFSVFREGRLDFVYEIRLRAHPLPDFTGSHASGQSGEYYSAEVFLKRGSQAYDLYGVDREMILNDLVDQFEKYLRFLHISPGTLPWQMEAHDELLK
ncbi:MAG: BCCT family transporter [Campylobacterales bacterium]